MEFDKSYTSQLLHKFKSHLSEWIFIVLSVAECWVILYLDCFWFLNDPFLSRQISGMLFANIC